jgi:hypothetical protein
VYFLQGHKKDPTFERLLSERKDNGGVRGHPAVVIDKNILPDGTQVVVLLHATSQAIRAGKYGYLEVVRQVSNSQQVQVAPGSNEFKKRTFIYTGTKWTVEAQSLVPLKEYASDTGLNIRLSEEALTRLRTDAALFERKRTPSPPSGSWRREQRRSPN